MRDGLIRLGERTMRWTTECWESDLQQRLVAPVRRWVLPDAPSIAFAGHQAGGHNADLWGHRRDQRGTRASGRASPPPARRCARGRGPCFLVSYLCVRFRAHAADPARSCKQRFDPPVSPARSLSSSGWRTSRDRLGDGVNVGRCRRRTAARRRRQSSGLPRS